MSDVAITELEELTAEKVSGVGNPANGTPWLLLKASEPEPIDNAPAQPGPSSEADAIEDEMTKAVDALGLLHDYAAKGTVTASELAEVQSFIDGLGKETVEKAKLKAKERNALPDSAFAYIDSHGGRHLPVQDAAHVRNALARFDQTHFESAEAKAKAHRKIVARAKELGVEVEKGSPGVPDEATETPTENGHVDDAGRSGLAGPETAGVRHPHGDPSFALGGESTYEIPVEGRVTDHPAEPGRINRGGGMEVGKQWEIEVVGKDNWLSRENPTPAEETTPGDTAWETYDAETLDGVARGLAAAAQAVEAIRTREAIEAISGNPSEWLDAYQLDCAGADIASALALVAALAYHEQAAEHGAEKAGRRHSARDLAMLRAARDHLNDLLGEHDKPAGDGAKASEEEDIMTTVTKEELAQTIAKASKQGFMEALVDQRKAAKKAERKAAKAAKKQAKKNANNGGDITAGEENAAVHSTHDADDVASVGGGETPSIAKSGGKNKLVKEVAELRGLVEKMASRPRSGGPVLDGVARGAFPASEGRLTETVTKSENSEIERLAKELDEVSKRPGPENAAKASEISQQLTLARLREAHAHGLI